MHKNTKLTPLIRKEIYELWDGGETVAEIEREFRVTRRIIYIILKRALGRLAKKVQRYEKKYPGEMLHFDTKKLRPARKDWKKKSEVLYVAIDDYSRQLFADIFPQKNAMTSALFLEMVLDLAPYSVEEVYSDNECEFKGNPKSHDFVWFCMDHGMQQSFTRVRRPQTNGKAERVIRTLMEECLSKYAYKTGEERRQALQKYVQYYNEHRPHSALRKGKIILTPCQVIETYVNSKVYTTR